LSGRATGKAGGNVDVVISSKISCRASDPRKRGIVCLLLYSTGVEYESKRRV
jgi:hypothetical protein